MIVIDGAENSTQEKAQKRFVWHLVPQKGIEPLALHASVEIP